MIRNAYVIKGLKNTEKLLIVMEPKSEGLYYCLLYPGYELYVVAEKDLQTDAVELLETLPEDVFKAFATRYNLMHAADVLS